MPAMAPTDSALLREYVAAGSRDALGQLVVRHIDFVHAVARRELRGRADLIPDVVQAVFLVLARKAQSVRGERLSSWLFTTTRYAAMNARKVAARRAHHERRAAKPEPVMPPSPTHTLEAAAAADHINDALARLRDGERAVVLMRHVQGFDVATISATTGLSEAAIRKRLERAIDRMRRYLQGRGLAPSVAVVASAVGGLCAGNPAATAATPALLSTILSTLTTPAATTVAATTGSGMIANGVMHMMTLAKLKAAAAVVAAVTILGGTATTVVQTVRAQPAEASVIVAAPATAPTPAPGAVSVGADGDVNPTVADLDSRAAASPDGTTTTPIAAPAPNAAPRPVPAGMVVFHGVVTDPEGRPVEGARVWSEVRGRDLVPPQLEEAVTTTDAAGRFEFPPLLVIDATKGSGSPGRTILFEARGHPLAWRVSKDNQSGRADVSVQFDIASEITGAVTDTAGRPVIGAAVSLALQRYSNHRGWFDLRGEYGHWRMDEGNARTTPADPAGRFRIPRMPAGARAHVTIRHRDYATFSTHQLSAEAPVVPGGTPLSAVLQPGGIVRGELVDEHGARVAVPGRVWASGERNGMGGSAETRADGSFEITGLAAGTWTVRFTPFNRGAVTHLWMPATDVAVTPSEPTNVVIRYVAGVPVTGRVIEEGTGRPLAKQDVSAHPADAKGPFIGSATGVDGRFTLHVTPGEYTLTVASFPGERMSDGVTRPFVVTGNTPTDLGDIAAVPQLRLRMRLVDAAGTPVAGTVHFDGNDYTTSADGRMEAPAYNRGMPMMDRRVMAVAGELSAAVHLDRIPTEPIDLTVRPPATITGRVLGPDGRPEDDAQISLAQGSEGQSFGIGMREPWVRLKRLSDGRFELTGIPMGDRIKYTVQAERPGWVASGDLAGLKSGEHRDVGDMTLKPSGLTEGTLQPRKDVPTDLSGTVGGIVVNEAGTPIVGARVSGFSLAVRSNQPRAVSDVGGRFTLHGLPLREPLTVFVQEEPYDEARLDDVRAGTKDLRVVLHREGAALVGKPAPELSVERWVHAKPVTLADLRGQVIVLRIGASVWQYEGTNAHLTEAVKRFGDRGLRVIEVLADPRTHQFPQISIEDVEQQVNQMNLTGVTFAIDGVEGLPPGYVNPRKTQERYGITDPPALILIDRKGIVRGSGMKDDLLEQVEKLIVE